jgi:leucyl/phenylalanyl-tRNA--protein transferase
MVDLTPDIVLQAYRMGIFPMASHRGSHELKWYDPDPRAGLPIAGLHVSKSLRRAIRQRPYVITFDKAFRAVMQACADTRPDTWINDEIIDLYTALHGQGFAHSVEAWENGKLVGGLYGVSIGAAFFGESMFSIATDASKIALVYLAARLWRQGFELLDTQFTNEHLKQFGVYEIPRDEYKRRLTSAISKNVSFEKNQSCGSSAGSSAGVGSFTGAGSGVSASRPLEGSTAGGASFAGSVGDASLAGSVSNPSVAGSAGLSFAGSAGTPGFKSDAGTAGCASPDLDSDAGTAGCASPDLDSDAGTASGAFSDEKSCGFDDDVAAFLQSITQTS